MKKLSKFTDIGQYRNVVSTIKRMSEFDGVDEDGNAILNPSKTKPTLKFVGTIKLHGTNFSVIQNPEGDIYFQSRERVIGIERDNAGSAMFGEARKDIFKEMFKTIRTELTVPDNLAIGIYGEWAGSGVQSKVAISELEKAFYIFAVKIIDFEDESKNFYVPHNNKILRNLRSPDNRIYNIYDFPTYEIEINFNDPVDVAEKQNLMIEQTLAVEEECPVAKHFGVSGLGEGIVYTTNWRDVTLTMKSKGEKHAKGSKVKTLRPVDNEKINRLVNLANQVTPVWRLDQMLETTCDFMNGGTFDRSKLGDFIRNVFADIVKEESDILIQEQVELKEINKYISNICREFFFNREKELVNI